MTPSLALGSAVHEVLEGLSHLPKDKRFLKPLLVSFDEVWQKVAGEKGGFWDTDTEYRYKQRGQEMLRRVANHPGPLVGLSVKITDDLPFFWLAEDSNIILCGKIDWLEYLPETDSVHIIDFKTGRSEEDSASLQLPIYYLLVMNCQKRNVTKASYWYLQNSDALTEKTLPDGAEARQKVLAIAEQIKTARAIDRLRCPAGADGCRYCVPMEKVARREGKLVGEDNFQADVYILPKDDVADMESQIL